jgi:predicted DNA-binding transcriptional regulator AlpA
LSDVQKLTVSVQDAVAMTGLSRQVLYAHIKSGDLPSALVNSRRLIRVADLQAFIDARMVA